LQVKQFLATIFKAKRLLGKYILESCLSDSTLAPYVSFWARFVVSVRKPLIIAVTGSVGKTTTTEMIAALLTHQDAKRIVGRVGKTSNNMNGIMGLPLTVLRYEVWREPWAPRWDGTRKILSMGLLPLRAVALAVSSRYPNILVLEYGTNTKGHIQHLCEIARPGISVVTTIGPAHLERLKTIEGVMEEKSAVVRTVPSSGLVILGDNHGYVADLARKAEAPVIKVTGRGVELSQNVARAIGQRLKLPEEIINSALADFKFPKGRLNRLELGHLTIIDDSYNANPLSMKLGLDTLAGTTAPGQRRVAILGTMGELGEEGPRYHNEIGAYARGRADVVIGVGTLAKHYNPDHWFDDSEACANQLEDLIHSGDCLLVKGSASIRMAHVTKQLRELAEKRSGAPVT
jgi:UDP-N-acetylmuramoyl-tripeptide--D-alanyl-D-alanine ligase